LGTGAFVEYPDARGVPVIDYIRGDRIYPLTWDGERVLECAFASRKTLLVGAHRVRGYYLQVHLQEGDQWRIRNIYLDEHGGEIPAPEGIRPVSERSPIPLFQIVRPNTTNCVDLENPMGMSIFGTAVEQLKACDIVYDSYVTEFVLGKKRLMVPETLAQAMINASGTVDLRFDPADELIYVYPQAEDGKDGIKEIDLHLRATEHEQALQRQMDLTAKKCGLGVGRYRFDAGVSANKTATEVISSKSDLYQSLKRHEKTFETAIVGMVQALCWLSGGKADAEVQVAFDDSIIEDVNATIQRNTLLVNSGLRSKVDAIMAIEQCEESVAKRKLAAIQAENGLGAELGGEMGGEAVPDSLTAQTVKSGIGKTLNGAQTQALVGILTQYTQGQITLGQAIKVISISIGVTEAEAKAILEGIASGGEA
ncbi:MAG: phage portal protein, partial [Clostridia bacterium]